MTIERRRYLFRGHVQGVGFRATTRRIAGEFALSGFVRNLPDGSVEVVAEGQPEELEAFVAAVKNAFNGMIRGIHHEPEPAGEPFDGFSIRY